MLTCRCSAACILVLLTGGAVLGLAETASAQSLEEQRLLKSILDAWTRERERVRSVRYRATGEEMIPKDAYASDEITFPTDYRHPISGEWLIDFPHNVFRHRWTSETLIMNRGVFHPEDDIYYFNGRDLVCHRAAVTDNRGTFFSPTQVDFYYHDIIKPVLQHMRLPPFLASGYWPCHYFSDDRADRKKMCAITEQNVSWHGLAPLDGEELRRAPDGFSQQKRSNSRNLDPTGARASGGPHNVAERRRRRGRPF